MELILQPSLRAMDQLDYLYPRKVGPLEEIYEKYYIPDMESLNLSSKPFILILGQEGSGKTSFIHHLLGKEFPGMKINSANQKLSTHFTALLHADSTQAEQLISGNAHHVTHPHNNEYAPLKRFGLEFLSKFQISMVKSSVLEHISIVDTPGIHISQNLNDNQNGLARDYDFIQVVKWFAMRADRIILIFDPCTLNLSEEFCTILEAIKAQERRIRIVLNKIDILDRSELRRVQGILLWNLGRVMKNSDIPLVITGACHAKSFLCETHREFVQEDMEKLLNDFQTLPENPALRKLLQLQKRALLALVYGCIFGSIRGHMPVMGVLGYSPTVKKLVINNLKEIYTGVCEEHQISWDDMPDIGKVQETLAGHDFYSFPPFPAELVEEVKQFLRKDIPKLHDQAIVEEVKDGRREIVGGAFDSLAAFKASSLDPLYHPLKTSLEILIAEEKLY